MGMVWVVGWLAIKLAPWFVVLVAALAVQLVNWGSLNLGIAAAVVAVLISASRTTEQQLSRASVHRANADA